MRNRKVRGEEEEAPSGSVPPWLLPSSVLSLLAPNSGVSHLWSGVGLGPYVCTVPTGVTSLKPSSGGGDVLSPFMLFLFSVSVIFLKLRHQ